MPRTATALMLSALCLLPMVAQAGQSADDTQTSGVEPQATLITRNPFMPLPPVKQPSRRPAILPALYASFVGLQAFDGYTTTKGLERGAKESNPLLGRLAGNPAALWSVKAGVTVGSIYAAEHLWRQHKRAAAIAVMVASNGVMAAVAMRNASVTRAQR